MSFMSSIFGGIGTNPAPAATTTPAEPGNLPASGTNSNTAPVGNTPAAEVKTPEPEKNPLDAFNDIWKDVPKSDGETPPPSITSVDPAKLMEAASKVDFTRILKPEDLQAISAGGEPAVAALSKALNSVAQTVYGQSALATTKIVERAVQEATEKFQSQIPELIKRQSLNSSLKDENPAFAHEAVKPIVEALESRLSVKHPSATPKELTKMAQDYFSHALSQLSPTKKEEEIVTGPGGKKEPDWAKLFGVAP